MKESDKKELKRLCKIGLLQQAVQFSLARVTKIQSKIYN